MYVNKYAFIALLSLIEHGEASSTIDLVARIDSVDRVLANRKDRKTN